MKTSLRINIELTASISYFKLDSENPNVFYVSYKAFKCLLMPCPFTGHKMFCASPNFLCRTKNLFTYCASHKHFVPDKKMICIQ